MKKLLIISNQFPNKQNPVQGIYVKEQALELKKYFKVNVFTVQNTGTNSISNYCSDKIDVTYVQFSFRKFLFSPLKYFIAVREPLKKILRDYNPDIIHVHDYQHIPDVFVLSFLLKKYISKTVVTFHNSRQLFDSHLYMRWFYKATLRNVLAKFNKIIVVSNKLNKMISKYCSSNNVRIIGNGIRAIEYHCSKDQLEPFIQKIDKNYFNIIAVGNLTPTKGFDLLIKTVVELIKLNYKINLHIFGNGSEKEKLEGIVVSNNLSENVFLHGRLENRIIRNLYKYFDAFVLPSWSETFGIVYLEAMYSKIPIIGVRGEGIDGVIIHKENGLLCESRDLDTLMECILYIMNEKGKIKKIVNNAYNLVMNKYVMQKIVEQIMDYYEA